MSKDVAIIVLNWNGWRDTIECISSLLDIEHDCYSLVVWDNGSSDLSIGMIEDYLCKRRIPYQIHEESAACSDHPEWYESGVPNAQAFFNDSNRAGHAISAPRIHLVQGVTNRGFAGGCNAGINFAFRVLQPDYLLLLNNDTIVKADFLGHLVEVAENNSEVGILGPTILYHNKNGRDDIIWGRGGVVNFRRYPFLRHLDNSKLLSDKPDTEHFLCEWVSGAALMFSARISVKTLDSSFFFGNEDVDFSMTNKKYGWKTGVVPKSIVWHKAGRSRKKRYGNKVAESLEYLSQNMRLYGKHERYCHLLIPLITVQFVLLTIRTTIQDVKSRFR